MRFSLLAFCLAVLAALTTVSTSAETPPAGRISLVTNIETDPAWVKEAIAALRTYREATRKEAGAIRVDFYQEIGRPNRFLIDEYWKDFAASDAHVKASKLADGLKAGLLAPPDIRPQTDFSVADARKAPGANDFYVFTHLDMHPPYLEIEEVLLRKYVEKSRGDKGMVRCDALQGLLTPAEVLLGDRSPVKHRKNHVTLAEAWASEADFRAHEASAHAIEFRTKVAPLLGAQFDQRLYQLVK